MLKTLCLLLALSTAAPALAQTDAATPDGFTVGVCTHYSQRKGDLPENTRLIRAAGVESVRDEVPWDVVEREKGRMVIPERADAYVDAARAAGMDVVLVLAYGNRHYEKGKKPSEPESIAAFADYCRFVVNHFKGRVTRYEVWNEWNIGIGTAGGAAGTPEGYMALIEPAYKAIKQADPAAEVIGGVVAPQALGDGFFEKLLALGLTRHCDAVSVHTYNYAARPPERRRPEAWLERMRSIQQTVRDASGQRRVPIYVTEHGWPTQAGDTGTPEHRSADFLARMYLAGRTLENLGGIWWYDFQDDGWNPQYNEDNFGLVEPDLTPKPSYHALADVAGLFADTRFEGREDLGDADVWLLRFRRADGRLTLAAWSAGQRRQIVLAPVDGAAESPARVRLVGRPTVERAWRHRDWVGQPRGEVVEKLAVFTGPTPILVELTAAGDVRAELLPPRDDAAD